MPRRRYDMSRRSAQVEATRRRIVEATMDLHNSQGVLATSWEEIAQRAGVAPGTVYRHFPTLDELLPACGALSLKRLELPSDDAIERVLTGARSRRARVRRLVDELFAIYERGAGVIWAIRRDRAELAQLQAAHEEVEERLDALAAAALGPVGIEGRDRAVVRALSDYGVWAALRERGVTGTDAAEITAAAIDAWLARR